MNKISISKSEKVFPIVENKVVDKYVVRGVGPQAIEVMFYKSTDLDQLTYETTNLLVEYCAVLVKKKGMRRICMVRMSGAPDFYHLFNRHDFKHRDKNHDWWKTKGFHLFDAWGYQLTEIMKSRPSTAVIASEYDDYRNIWATDASDNRWINPKILDRLEKVQDDGAHKTILREILTMDAPKFIKLDRSRPGGNSVALELMRSIMVGHTRQGKVINYNPVDLNPEFLNTVNLPLVSGSIPHLPRNIMFRKSEKG